jgi:hypothetical protein
MKKSLRDPVYQATFSAANQAVSNSSFYMGTLFWRQGYFLYNTNQDMYDVLVSGGARAGAGSEGWQGTAAAAPASLLAWARQLGSGAAAAAAACPPAHESCAAEEAVKAHHLSRSWRPLRPPAHQLAAPGPTLSAALMWRGSSRQLHLLLPSLAMICSTALRCFTQPHVAPA